MAELFWLSDAQWALIEPLLPDLGGKPRVDDRRVISGILHRFREGLRWRAVPGDYGPRTTLYNRFNPWSKRGLWQQLFASLAITDDPPSVAMVDSTVVRAHRADGEHTLLASTDPSLTRPNLDVIDNIDSSNHHTGSAWNDATKVWDSMCSDLTA